MGDHWPRRIRYRYRGRNLGVTRVCGAFSVTEKVAQNGRLVLYPVALFCSPLWWDGLRWHTSQRCVELGEFGPVRGPGMLNGVTSVKFATVGTNQHYRRENAVVANNLTHLCQQTSLRSPIRHTFVRNGARAPHSGAPWQGLSPITKFGLDVSQRDFKYNSRHINPRANKTGTGMRPENLKRTEPFGFLSSDAEYLKITVPFISLISLPVYL
jgi:hypothetical protein